MFLNSQHKNDPRIPQAGTPEWTELMRRSEVVDFQTLNPGKTPAKRKKPRPTATSIDQIQVRYYQG